jgi:hypothetical protein
LNNQAGWTLQNKAFGPASRHGLQGVAPILDADFGLVTVSVTVLMELIQCRT